MFDCNRLNWKDQVPNYDYTSKTPKGAQFIYTFSTSSGRPTKAINCSTHYVKHLRTQVKDTGMMFPSAIALLNGHGSINCVHNMKKPVYAPI